jgi:tetratricopeptide (TPR) repeat protein
MNRQQRQVGARSGRTTPLRTTANRLQTGLQHQLAGRLAAAEACYRGVLAAQPRNADALHLLGVIAHRSRRHDDAVALFGQAIGCNRRNPLFFSNLGVAQQHRGRLDEALGAYDCALALKPDYAEAHNNRGIALAEQKRLEEALAAYDSALAVLPAYVEAWFNRGNVLGELRRFEEAVASYDALLKLRPDHAAALNNRGNALRALRRLDEALESYDRALALAPDYAEAFNNRGVVCQELSRFDEAVKDYGKALALLPGCAEVLFNFGNTLQALGRFDDAVASYDHGLALKPDHAEACYNRGIALQELRRIDEALASYDQAVALRPDYAEAHWNESYLRLLTGDFERGLPKSEWRWRNTALGLHKRDFARPLWQGDLPIEGRTILLHHDEGLGDAIFYCRYVPLLAARGARVIVAIEEPLRQLVSGLAGVWRCIGPSETPPDFDLHCPMSSLPLAFETRLATIPAAPYLRAAVTDKQLASKDPATRRRTDRPKVGLAWAGNPRHVNDRNRSMPLTALSPLLDVGATFVTLQKDLRAGDDATLSARGEILNVGPVLQNFADSAALVAELDLVITVDTSVAHLAGALGVPVWVLLPFAPDWRWLLDRDDSPWYPTARLFRQDEAREWSRVVQRVRDQLRAFVGNYRAGTGLPAP